MHYTELCDGEQVGKSSRLEPLLGPYNRGRHTDGKRLLFAACDRSRLISSDRTPADSLSRVSYNKAAAKDRQPG